MLSRSVIRTKGFKGKVSHFSQPLVTYLILVKTNMADREVVAVFFYTASDEVHNSQ